LEIGLRLDLHERCGIAEPYRLANFEGLNSAPLSLVNRLRATGNTNFVRLGFRELVELLLSQNSEVAFLYDSTNGAKKAVQIRNDLAHQLGCASQERAFNAIGDISKVLAPLILPTPPRFPKDLVAA
jgi:hypothetical protein